MITLNEIRREVDRMLLKYCTQVNLYKARDVAYEFCEEMEDVLTGRKEDPKRTSLAWAREVFMRMQKRRVRVTGYVGLSDYLERCRNRKVLPQFTEIMRSLFPKARDKGLIPRTHEEEVPIPPKPAAATA